MLDELTLQKLNPIGVGLLAEAIMFAFDNTPGTENLTLRHFRVLLTLGCHQYASDEEPVEQSALEHHLGWPRSTLSRIISDLAGYSDVVDVPLIEILPHPTSRKQHVIRLASPAYKLRDEGSFMAIERLMGTPYPIPKSQAQQQ